MIATIKPKDSRVIVPRTTGRDALIAVVGGLLALAFMAYGFVHFAQLSAKAKSSALTGVIVERQFTVAPEQQITVGRKGLKSQQLDGEYLFKVRVDSEHGRIFDVPVEKELYDTKKIGDSLAFMRPPSERQ